MLTDEDKSWILEQFENQKNWTLEQLERVETTLLTEFHKWASPAEMRARSHAAAIRALDLEMENLDERVKKLEDQKQDPDAA